MSDIGDNCHPHILTGFKSCHFKASLDPNIPFLLLFTDHLSQETIRDCGEGLNKKLKNIRILVSLEWSSIESYRIS